MLNFTHKRSESPGAESTPRRPPDGAERATFAAGCFWGVEAAFREIEGVVKTSVGYTGGSSDRSDLRAGVLGSTGHAEAVEVWFDPAMVSYDELLSTFWSIHDPTTATGRAGTSAASTARRSSSTTPSRSARRSPRATSARGA